MLFGKKEQTSAEDFWKNRESELGTTILGRTLGRVIIEDSTVPLWGLFYTTADAVYFQTFQSDNWISLMFSGGKGSGRSKDETIEIPRSTLIRFELKERKHSFFGLFRHPPLVEIVWKSEESGEEETMLFEMEGDARAFVESFPKS